MAKVTVALKGISPLIMHAFPLMPVEGYEKLKPNEQAEISAYRLPDTKELYIPGVNIQRALVSAATYSKGKVGARWRSSDSIRHFDVLGRHDVRLKRHCALVG